METSEFRSLLYTSCATFPTIDKTAAQRHSSFRNLRSVFMHHLGLLSEVVQLRIRWNELVCLHSHLFVKLHFTQVAVHCNRFFLQNLTHIAREVIYK